MLSFGKVLKVSGVCLVGTLLLSSNLMAASSISLGQSAAQAGPYSTNGFNICGSGTRTFFLSYNNGYNPGGVVGPNPYRMTARLYKDGNPINTSVFQGSAAWSNHPFYNVSVTPGTYSATMLLEKKTLTGWKLVEPRNSNTIVVTTNATPDFNVNGIAVPASGGPFEVCASSIKINAGASSCETRYWIGVQERDQYWGRTYKYEWGNWYAGPAPDGISLQQLAVGSANWLGNDLSQKGKILYCGYLDAPANTLPRHYVVGICTDEPSWQCKSALIKLNCSC